MDCPTVTRTQRKISGARWEGGYLPLVVMIPEITECYFVIEKPVDLSINHTFQGILLPPEKGVVSSKPLEDSGLRATLNTAKVHMPQAIFFDHFNPCRLSVRAVESEAIRALRARAQTNIQMKPRILARQ